MPAATPTKEPRVSPTAPMPPGYRFVKKGNVYITANCRRQTRASGATVYVVADPPSSTSSSSVLGIRVPRAVWLAVEQAERESRDCRAAGVRARDDAAARALELEVQKLFPRIPDGVAARVAGHALVKRSGRVGRAAAVDVARRARLAVVAHVRHCHTPYDALLRGGTGREEARKSVWARVNEVADEWAGGKGGKREERKKHPKAGGEGEVVLKNKSREEAGKRKEKGKGKGTVAKAVRANDANSKKVLRAGRVAASATTTAKKVTRLARSRKEVRDASAKQKDATAVTGRNKTATAASASRSSGAAGKRPGAPAIEARGGIPRLTRRKITVVVNEGHGDYEDEKEEEDSSPEGADEDDMQEANGDEGAEFTDSAHSDLDVTDWRGDEDSDGSEWTPLAT